MKMKMKSITLLLIVIFLLMPPVITNAFYDKAHAGTQLFTNATYGAEGLKGDFTLPYIDSKWSTTYPGNFITFEQWITVNEYAYPPNSNWFEIGYMDGSMNHNREGITYYKGFFKAKFINNQYWESKLSKTATVNETYTFTIADFDCHGLWEIYIGMDYFGAFSDTVYVSDDLKVDQGYEFNHEEESPAQVWSSTTISNQMIRQGYTWHDWTYFMNLYNVGVTIVNSLPITSVTFNNNTTTLTQ